MRGCCSLPLTAGKLAPADWYEFYTSVSVERWMLWWTQSMCSDQSATPHKRLCERGQPKYQHVLEGTYTVVHSPATTTTVHKAGDEPEERTGGAKLDFVWLPARKTSGTEPIVVLEVDENAHRSKGWDAERSREVFVLRKLQEDYPHCPRITIIRFNPHEYNTKVQPAAAPPAAGSEGGAPPARRQQRSSRRTRTSAAEQPLPAEAATYTTEPSRDVRLHQLSQLIEYGLARHTEYANVKVAIFFAYYDRRWEMLKETRQEKYEGIVSYIYPSIDAYAADVKRGSGRYLRWMDRKMFYKPKFWTQRVPATVREWTKELDAVKKVQDMLKEEETD